MIKESPDDEITERIIWADISYLQNIEAWRIFYNYFKDHRISTYF